MDGAGWDHSPLRGQHEGISSRRGEIPAETTPRDFARCAPLWSALSPIHKDGRIVTDIADDDRTLPNGNVPRWWRFLATLGVLGVLGVIADTMQIISFDVGDVWFLTEDPERPHPSG